MGKEINRLKAVLAEVGKTNVWLAEQLGVNPRPYRSGVRLQIKTVKWIT